MRARVLIVAAGILLAAVFHHAMRADQRALCERDEVECPHAG